MCRLGDFLKDVEVSEATEEAKGSLGTERAKAWSESQEQFYSTKAQNLKWGGMRLRKVDMNSNTVLGNLHCILHAAGSHLRLEAQIAES